MRWGLIGASDIAETRMVDAIRQHGHHVVGVLSSSVERAEAFATRAKLERSTNSLDELLSWDVDAVYISTTNELHAQQAVAAAQAGKHILCEKPLAMNVDDAKAMILEAQNHSVVLATNHHLRCAQTHRVMRDIVTSGELGTVFSVQINHTVSLPERLRGWRLNSPEKGAGILLDITVHNIDLARFLLGENLVSVFAQTTNRGFGQLNVPDESICSFVSDTGILVSTHESFNTPFAQTSVEIFGSDGNVLGRNVLTQDPVGDVVVTNATGQRTLDLGVPENLYVRLLEKFTEAVEGTGSPASSGVDGLHSTAMALAAMKSSVEHRVVHLRELL